MCGVTTAGMWYWENYLRQIWGWRAEHSCQRFDRVAENLWMLIWWIFPWTWLLGRRTLKILLCQTVREDFCITAPASDPPAPNRGFLLNILWEPAKPCETAHYAAFPDNRPPQLLRIYYQGMSFDTTKHREMRTYGTAPPFEQPPKITYCPTA